MNEFTVVSTNPAKLEQVKSALADTPIVIHTINATDTLPEFIEDGATVQDNARKKALAFARALNRPVLSMDNGLYLEGLPPEDQPGQHVRRIRRDDQRIDDDAMISHYLELVRRISDQDGTARGRWEIAVCVATPDGNLRETTVISQRIFTTHLSPRRIPGFPHESMQIDPTSGRYFSDMSQDEQAAFWRQHIGEPLKTFLQNVEFN